MRLRINRAASGAAVLGAALLFTATRGIAPAAPPVSEPPSRDTPPNFVLVMTDDQRWDTLRSMPFVRRKLAPAAVDFANAYVTSPSCCPVRAGLLAGGFYAHEVGVLTNEEPNGGATRFDDARTFPLRLQQAGYRTAHFGKYLNKYMQIAPHIPPGWNRFLASASLGGSWTRFRVVDSLDGTPTTAGRFEVREGHLVKHDMAAAVDFLDTVGTDPFFLMVCPHAPHPPATPEERDEGRFDEFLYRDRAWGEDDLLDKPRWVRNQARRFDEQVAERDVLHRDQMRSLRSIDRGLRALWRRLERSGRLDNTVFVFMSDNGFQWGEHRLWDKGLPYEESVRVPLLVAAPGAAPRTERRLVAANLDVPASILVLAGIDDATTVSEHSDGLSLAPLLWPDGTNPVWRRDLPLEFWQPPWTALLTAASLFGEANAPGWDWKYIEHSSAEVEVYESASDPWELESCEACLLASGLSDRIIDRLESERPLAVRTEVLPAGAVGTAYDARILAWGGTPPYSWSHFAGQLPPGLSLDPGTGRLHGVPGAGGEYRFEARVTDASVARYTGLPQFHVREIRVTIGP